MARHGRRVRWRACFKELGAVHVTFRQSVESLATDGRRGGRGPRLPCRSGGFFSKTRYRPDRDQLAFDDLGAPCESRGAQAIAGVAVLVIGLSDLTFLAGYFGYMKLFSPISSHWTQYDDPRWMAMSAAVGTALAVRTAVRLRRMLWPRQSIASKRATWRLELGRAVTAVVISRVILEFLD